MKKLQKLPFEEFKFIFSRVPRICIEVIIQTKEGVLLTLRDIEPFKGYWHIPGGGLLIGEKIIAAVHRITQEETGLKIKVIRQLPILEYVNLRSSNKSGYSHAISIPFLVAPISKRIQGNTQATEIKFFNKLPSKIIPYHKKCLQKNNLV